MRFDPGMLKSRIKVLIASEIENKLHQRRKQLVPQYINLPAKIIDIRGNKYYDAKKMVPEITHFVYIRYRQEPIHQDQYIEYKDRLFEVRFCHDMYDDKTCYEIQCIEKPKAVIQ